MDTHLIALVVFLDLKTTFDTVDVDKLILSLKKLWNKGNTTVVVSELF